MDLKLLFRRILRQYPVQLALLALSGVTGGALAVLQLASGRRQGAGAAVLVSLAVFLATAVQALLQGARELIASQEAGRATGEAATELQAFVAERLPSLLDYLGRLASAPAADRAMLAEGLESLVVDAAASLYGRAGLRAVVLHVRDGDLVPGNFRRGWGTAAPPRIERGSRLARRASELLEEPVIVWVDDPTDPRHADQLAWRPDGNYQSFIRVPIIAGERAFGLLWADAPGLRDLTEADVPALELLARVLGTGLALAAAEYRAIQAVR